MGRAAAFRLHVEFGVGQHTPRFIRDGRMIWANHYRGARLSRRAQRLQYVRQQRLAADLMQHLGQRRKHARAFAGSENDCQARSHHSLQVGAVIAERGQPEKPATAPSPQQEQRLQRESANVFN
jgi:hypothetical protein